MSDIMALVKIKTNVCVRKLLYSRFISYQQGQYISPKIREYFYFIDHNGQLFLDDTKMKNFTSCFKEKKFLEFFFKRIKKNETGSYEEEFPYFSPCGRERNYIRCDDLPIVFTNFTSDKNFDKLTFNWGGELLTVDFEPDKVCMLPLSGRVYHPAMDRLGGVGLVKSSLAIEFSKYFEFKDEQQTTPPTHFTWNEKRYTLTQKLIPLLEKEHSRSNPKMFSD